MYNVCIIIIIIIIIVIIIRPRYYYTCHYNRVWSGCTHQNLHVDDCV